MLELNRIYNMDCMEGMKQFPDKYFELAIVDPPYFKGFGAGDYFKVDKEHPQYAKNQHWDIGIPDIKYFDELKRVSEEQIIWGINYYNFLPETTGRIIWDKQNDNATFSNCEIASCTLIDNVKVARFLWDGFRRCEKTKRFHPTQKPVALYKWLLKNYARPGDKILDTHMGSGSSIIACIDYGFEYIAFEIDKDYFESANERIEAHKAQGTIFEKQEEPEAEQGNIV
jgi:site-specific DNA-methyltransferase (adenine-specific)